MGAATVEMEKVIKRDARVDQIGFVGELNKTFVNDLKTAVKVRMAGEALDGVDGDFFDGMLITGIMTRSVDPENLLKMYEKRQITKAEFLSAIKVNLGPLEKFLSGKEIDKMADSVPAENQLRVSRKQGVEAELIAAVKKLGGRLTEAL